jgi:hypothetical protein
MLSPLSDKIPVVGERVFINGLEQGVYPTYTTLEGMIVRQGSSAGARGIRVFSNTNTAFRKTYCGAPVLDAAKVVIGMVSGVASTGETEIVPALHITKLMNRMGLKYDCSS